MRHLKHVTWNVAIMVCVLLLSHQKVLINTSVNASKDTMERIVKRRYAQAHRYHVHIQMDIVNAQ